MLLHNTPWPTGTVSMLFMPEWPHHKSTVVVPHNLQTAYAVGRTPSPSRFPWYNGNQKEMILFYYSYTRREGGYCGVKRGISPL